MALFPDPFGTLASLQQAMDAFRESAWLDAGPSAGGGFPSINAFRKGDDYVLITELPGIKKSDLEVEVRGNTIRLSGTKAISYPEKASLHRRERLGGRFDRVVTLPIEIAADGVKAEYHDGVLALLLPRAERDKPKRISVS